jgi:hypothetical protein
MDRVEEVLDIVFRAKQLGDYDCNVIGMAGEIVAEEEFGMLKVPVGTKSIDGTVATPNGMRTLQVKAWSDARVKKYKKGTFLRLPVQNKADDLLLILFYASKKNYEVLYQGPVDEIGKLEKNGKTKIVRLDHVKIDEELERVLKEAFSA